MRNKRLGVVVMFLFFGIAVFGCSNDDDNKVNHDSKVDVVNRVNGLNLSYSVQVNNIAAARSLNENDIVELYIQTLEYNEDAVPRALMIIASGDREVQGEFFNNAGWYSTTANLSVVNPHANAGLYSSIMIKILKIKINGVEYYFHGNEDKTSGLWAHFGTPVSNLGNFQEYPDNFPGINLLDSDVSLKTVLTVLPDILNCWDENGIVKWEGLPNSGVYDPTFDPYTYIKIEGKVNE